MVGFDSGNASRYGSGRQQGFRACEKFHTHEKGRANDVVGAQLGISGRKYEKAGQPYI